MVRSIVLESQNFEQRITSHLSLRAAKQCAVFTQCFKGGLPYGVANLGLSWFLRLEFQEFPGSSIGILGQKPEIPASVGHF